MNWLDLFRGSRDGANRNPITRQGSLGQEKTELGAALFRLRERFLSKRNVSSWGVRILPACCFLLLQGNLALAEDAGSSLAAPELFEGIKSKNYADRVEATYALGQLCGQSEGRAEGDWSETVERLEAALQKESCADLGSDSCSVFRMQVWALGRCAALGGRVSTALLDQMSSPGRGSAGAEIEKAIAYSLAYPSEQSPDSPVRQVVEAFKGDPQKRQLIAGTFVLSLELVLKKGSTAEVREHIDRLTAEEAYEGEDGRKILGKIKVELARVLTESLVPGSGGDASRNVFFDGDRIVEPVIDLLLSQPAAAGPEDLVSVEERIRSESSRRGLIARLTRNILESPADTDREKKLLLEVLRRHLEAAREASVTPEENLEEGIVEEAPALFVSPHSVEGEGLLALLLNLDKEGLSQTFPLMREIQPESGSEIVAEATRRALAADNMSLLETVLESGEAAERAVIAGILPLLGSSSATGPSIDFLSRTFIEHLKANCGDGSRRYGREHYGLIIALGRLVDVPDVRDRSVDLLTQLYTCWSEPNLDLSFGLGSSFLQGLVRALDSPTADSDFKRRAVLTLGQAIRGQSPSGVTLSDAWLLTDSLVQLWAESTPSQPRWRPPSPRQEVGVPTPAVEAEQPAAAEEGVGGEAKVDEASAETGGRSAQPASRVESRPAEQPTKQTFVLGGGLFEGEPAEESGSQSTEKSEVSPVVPADRETTSSKVADGRENGAEDPEITELPFQMPEGSREKFTSVQERGGLASDVLPTTKFGQECLNWLRWLNRRYEGSDQLTNPSQWVIWWETQKLRIP